ncbi:MAG: DMT family transporter [Cyanobacteria bacterium P01_F01_bin.56]
MFGPPLTKDASNWWGTLLLTGAALIAFAGNSILSRLVLGHGWLDAATFSSLRLMFGAGTLALLLMLNGETHPLKGGNWRGATVLVVYAIAFSLSYLSLTTATGALILFGVTQVTMLLLALNAGNRPHILQWLGLGLALGGLIYLLLPGVEAPPIAGAALMGVAGIAWGSYTYLGHKSTAPLAQTAGNFLRAAPLAVIINVGLASQFHAELVGILLAAVVGALTSGLGYVAWYAALRNLAPIQAAVVQLCVPIIAAIGGFFLVSEPLSLRLILSALIILGGIALALLGREY